MKSIFKLLKAFQFNVAKNVASSTLNLWKLFEQLPLFEEFQSIPEVFRTFQASRSKIYAEYEQYLLMHIVDLMKISFKEKISLNSNQEKS